MPHHSEGDDRLGMFEYRNLDWDSTIIEDPIIQNFWYTPLLPVPNVKAYYLIVEQTNTGAADEDIAIELNIDGNIYVWAGAAMVSGTPRYFYFTANDVLGSSASERQMVSLDEDQSAPLETRSLGIRVRQTTAVDVVSAILEVNLVYATKERAP